MTAMNRPDAPARPPASDATFPFSAALSDAETGQPLHTNVPHSMIPAIQMAADSATGALFPGSALPEVIDSEHGIWLVDVPTDLAHSAESDGLYIDAIVYGVRIQIEMDPA